MMAISLEPVVWQGEGGDLAFGWWIAASLDWIERSSGLACLPPFSPLHAPAAETAETDKAMLSLLVDGKLGTRVDII